jgi:glycosyltransferase involved in cell wall biosynthesis
MPSAADLRPLLGRRGGRPWAARFLLICFYDPNGIGTVYESIARWQQLSEFELEILNLWPLRGDALRLPATLDLGEYDGVIVHAAVSYSLSNLDALDSQLRRPFEEYDGVKVLMKQDEQRMPALFAEYLGRKRYDLLLTCVPEAERPRVYPRATVGDLAFVQVLTGYVTEAMRRLSVPWSRSRPIGIGYRGSIQPLCFGRLGYEKRKIGDDVARALSGRPGLQLDISSRWEDRIYGAGWVDFLTSCKATLGVESGSNLFDFDGGVEQWCRDFEAAHPQMDRLSEDFYRLVDAEYLAGFEGNVDYAQVSPRHFEAAAARSLQILYEGRYSDIFEPGRHFLALARDLSNLDEVVGVLADERRCVEISECAFDEIVRNPRYGYGAFAAKVDPALDAALQHKGRAGHRPLAPARSRPRAVVLTAADPVQDPRFDWVAKSLAADHDVVEIGCYRFGTDGGGPSIERLSQHRARLRVERTRHESRWIPHPTTVAPSLSCGRQKLLYLAALADAPESLLRSTIGALDMLPEDLAQFRALARHVINSNAAVLEAVQRIGGFELIVATDLDTLAAGAILKDETGALLVYDAHEFWPYALYGMRHWQSEFWASFSRELVAAADLAITVSPPLAEVMAEEYGREFHAVPNCASLAEGEAVDIEQKLGGRPRSDQVVFLFQGAFAPGRGLEQLISAWQYVDPKARLLLRGLESEFKDTAIEIARSLGLLDRSVFFPRGVSEDRLIAAASEADIGFIPYEPISINNRLSCPNKLSQYLAAGLPVICNQLDFVKAVVVDNGMGFAVDFRDQKAVAAVVNNLVAAPDQIQLMARRARSYFEIQFHWEHVFEPVRRTILGFEGAQRANRNASDLDFSWIADQKVMRATSTEVARASASQIVEMVEKSPVAEAALRTAGLIGRVSALFRAPDRGARIAASLRYRAKRYLRQTKDYAAR